MGSIRTFIIYRLTKFHKFYIRSCRNISRGYVVVTYSKKVTEQKGASISMRNSAEQRNYCSQFRCSHEHKYPVGIYRKNKDMIICEPNEEEENDLFTGEGLGI
jgi:hypothetical protein